MPDQEQNTRSDFLIETIKQRPVNRKKLIRRTIITAAMAVIFGLIACLTFLILKPVISNWLYPEENPKVVVFPEDLEEMSPEEMLAENLQDNPVVNQQNPDQGEQQEGTGIELEEEQIEEILSGVTLDRENYIELYSSMSDYAVEMSRYMVTVTAVSSNRDWFNNVEERENQTAGLILTDNGMELLILTYASTISSAQSLIVTFYDDTRVEARIKQTDPSTNLAILAIDFDILPSGMKDGGLKYPALGSSNKQGMLGMPVIALGSPMGVSNSIGYGMVTASNTLYSIADRNYKLIQTDIAGSQNASGVLFNLEGQAIGFITDNKSSTDMKNVIYAYGVTEIRKTLENLSNGKTIAYLGISGVNVSPEASGELGVPLGGFVTKVDMDSPAMRAGIQKGDVIININDRNISTFNDYTTSILQLEPGEEVNLIVKRKSQEGYKEMNFSMEAQEVK